MKAYILFTAIFLFLSTFCIQAEQKEIPSQILQALSQKSGTTNQFIGFVSKENGDYYLIREIAPKGGAELEVNQILVFIGTDQYPQIIVRKPNIFPLSQYHLDQGLIQELAAQYVQDMIKQTPEGVKGIQDYMDYNPRLIPKDPELQEALKKAGVKIQE